MAAPRWQFRQPLRTPSNRSYPQFGTGAGSDEPPARIAAGEMRRCQSAGHRIADLILLLVCEDCAWAWRPPLAEFEAASRADLAGLVVVVSEMTTAGYIDIAQVVRDTIIAVGYDRAEQCFDGNTCGLITAIDKRAPRSSRACGATKPLDNNLARRLTREPLSHPLDTV